MARGRETTFGKRRTIHSWASGLHRRLATSYSCCGKPGKFFFTLSRSQSQDPITGDSEIGVVRPIQPDIDPNRFYWHNIRLAIHSNDSATSPRLCPGNPLLLEDNEMKKVLSAVLVSTLFASSPALAEDAPNAKDKKGRVVLREDRPDDARGWIVVAKSTYWPLCYEALDRLEETRALIGGTDKEELADSLEKNAAWLDLAASAAMTNGQAGITSASNRLSEAAAEIRAGTSKVSDSQLNDMITLGEVCMAKSHILRAFDPDTNYKASRVSANKTANPSKTVSVSEAQIRKDLVEKEIDQYRYDVNQTTRHLEVAKVYLASAKESGGLVLTEFDLADLPEISGNEKPFQLTDLGDDLRILADKMLQSVEQHRKSLAAKFE